MKDVIVLFSASCIAAISLLTILMSIPLTNTQLWLWYERWSFMILVTITSFSASAAVCSALLFIVLGSFFLYEAFENRHNK